MKMFINDIVEDRSNPKILSKVIGIDDTGYILEETCPIMNWVQEIHCVFELVHKFYKAPKS